LAPPVAAAFVGSLSLEHAAMANEANNAASDTCEIIRVADVMREILEVTTFYRIQNETGAVPDLLTESQVRSIT
jgi:phosphopantothenate synthetase